MSKSDPKAIQALDGKRQALMLLRQGVDVRTIAEQLDLGEAHVRIIASEEMTYLSLATQELQEHFVAMTWARTEKIASRILPDFDIDPPPPPDDLYDGVAMKEWREEVKYWRRMIAEGAKNYALVARLQKDILQVRGAGEKPKPGMTIENMEVNNITLTTRDAMYGEALEFIQRDYLGESYSEMQSRLLEESQHIDPLFDERLTTIELAVNKVHATPDPDDTETDS